VGIGGGSGGKLERETQWKYSSRGRLRQTQKDWGGGSMIDQGVLAKGEEMAEAHLEKC